jgi:uncharacterized protein
MSIKILIAAGSFLGSLLPGKTDKKELPEEKRQFIYVLRYTSQFKQAIKWTSKENKISSDHVLYLKTLLDEEKAYMAGRTSNIFDPDLFGIVIFDATNLEEAKIIMQNDPLVKNDIMQGEVKPFNIVFLKNKHD